MKEMTKKEFCEVLKDMSNDELCSFITFYEETHNNEALLIPTGINDLGFIEWVGRFTENGEPHDEKCKKIVGNILLNVSRFDYVLIEYLTSGQWIDYPIYTFLTKADLKENILKCPIVEKIYNDKAAWGDEFYANGATNDLYTMFNKHIDRYDLIAGIFYFREDRTIEVDKLSIVESNVDKNYIKNIDEHLCTLEKLGVADSYHYAYKDTVFKVYVKNEIDYQRINALPSYKGHVEIVKDFEEQ